MRIVIGDSGPRDVLALDSKDIHGRGFDVKDKDVRMETYHAKFLAKSGKAVYQA